MVVWWRIKKIVVETDNKINIKEALDNIITFYNIHFAKNEASLKNIVNVNNQCKYLGRKK